jgi:hypothetical protein
MIFEGQKKHLENRGNKYMLNFDKSVFCSYLVKGQLHNAITYLSKFPEKKDMLEMYTDIYENGHYYKRTENETLGNIDQIYQTYYRDLFWNNLSNDEAKEQLFYKLWIFCGSISDLPKDENIEDEIAKIVIAEGYEFLGGSTQGYFGPYIWKSSTNITYEVELPSGIEPYTITMMDDFISRSWLDFISFGQTGTGGWVGENGTLCCVRSSYEGGSEESFNISFLKHEAQHSYDKKKYFNITSVDLEYRAKLVELIYWPNSKKIKDIFREADTSNPDNCHSIAANRIIDKMKLKLFKQEIVNDESAWDEKVEDVKLYAGELLKESSKLLETSFAI